MTKPAAAKKVKKVPTMENGPSDCDPSIFEVRDRHYGSLLAIKKKIRACEKKIRELEQSVSDTESVSKKPVANLIETAEAKRERLQKLETKKIQLAIWKEAATCVHGARKEELAQGITNISMADAVEGIDLLKQVLSADAKWAHYKCPNKKHLTKVDIERIRQLARYLNIQPLSSAQSVDVSKSSSLSSFVSVVDYLSSPIAIGQECPMSFSEFVRLFDKLRKTLTVEIVVKEPVVEPVASIASATPNVVPEKPKETPSDITANNAKPEQQKNNRNRQKRSPRDRRPARKSHNGASSSNSPNKAKSGTESTNIVHSSTPSIPEKLVVVVTSNTKGKQHNDLSHSTITSTNASLEEVAKSNPAPSHAPKPEPTETTPVDIPAGRLIHNPNVPTDDSDEEGWISPNSSKQKTAPVEPQSYRQHQNGPRRVGFSVSNAGDRDRTGPRSGNSRGGNNYNPNKNSRRGPNPSRYNNGDSSNNTGGFRNNRQQPMNKSTPVVENESQW